MRLNRLERKGDGNDRYRSIGRLDGRAVSEVVCASEFARGTADALDERTGDDGVCHLGRRARRDCDSRDYGVPAKVARALERHRRGDKRLVVLLKDDSGQSTVEFAIVTVGFLAVTAALAAMWRAFGDGVLVEHALAVASHHIQSVAAATLVDIFLY